jgi:hypothetical protein
MPQLLTLPYAVPLSAVGVILPGSKLYFYATGTSTPQPVYTDIGLTVAHSQPVIANGAGRFAAIYLDPSLPNYRILLTDSADVTQPGYPIDNVPSQQNTAQQFRLKHTAPELIFEETDASTGNQKWRMRVNSEQLLIDIGNDAESSWANVAALTRSGNTPGSLNFAGQYLRVNSVLVATQENTSVAAATLTGVDSVVTGSVTIRRTGTKVSLIFPSTISGTSNTTAMTLTGMGLLNSSSGGIALCRVIDNGAVVLGTALIGSSSITFGVGAASGNFTGSGTKGIPGGTVIVYDTDIASIA